MYRKCLAAIAAFSVAAGLPPTAEVPPATAQTGVSCEVRISKRGGATVVDGYVSAPSGFNGSYRISVTGGGGDTDQSGEFSGSGGRTALGAVPVSGAGGFSARIVIKQNGVSRCTNAASGRI